MKKALGLILAALLLFTALPVAALADGSAAQARDQTGTIIKCKYAINVREKASTSAKVIGTAKKGEQFDVLGKSGNWVRIDYHGKTGFVYHTYLKVTGEPADETLNQKIAKIVNCKKQVNVRETASADAKILGVAKKGATFKALAISGSWVKIRFTDDTAGYVHKRYVKLSAEAESIEGKTGTVTCSNKVNVRAKATKSSKLLGTAKNGETFTVQGRSGNWIRIDYHGKVGYVYKRYMKIG